MKYWAPVKSYNPTRSPKSNVTRSRAVSAMLSAVVFNALVIVALREVALRFPLYHNLVLGLMLLGSLLGIVGVLLTMLLSVAAPCAVARDAAAVVDAR